MRQTAAAVSGTQLTGIPPTTAALRHLLAGVGGLDVVFQPLFELRPAGAVVHAVEGLIRGPKGTQLEQPERLFAFFRPRGEGTQLDALCLGTILMRAAALPGSPRLCLNVGAESVTSTFFLEELLQEAERAGISPYRLILDIGLDDPEFDQTRLVTAVRDIRRFGIRIAYDEGSPFATGFQLLMDAPPEYLKLHQSVVRALASDRDVRKTLIATVNLGQIAGFRVVAKGVERPADVEEVRGCGIDLVQGYHCARPAAARDPHMSELLRSVPGAWDDQHVR